eukprot:NODE_122_length_18870_cov_0.236908.p7 type:complete len:235 gc:universal NODE_122_length_18870_cov_0.236908:12209-11505(-)
MDDALNPGIIYLLILCFILLHGYILFNHTAKVSVYVIVGHAIHILFCLIFILGFAYANVQSILYLILNLIIVIEALSLSYPFVFKLRFEFQLLFGAFCVLYIGCTAALSFLSFYTGTVSVMMLLHIFINFLFILRPIRSNDIQVRFISGIACVTCMYQIYAALLSDGTSDVFIRELYMVIQSGILLAMTFEDPRPIHRATRVPITQRTANYQSESSASPTTPSKRQTFVTIEVP